jgi:hypothetical protein
LSRERMMRAAAAGLDDLDYCFRTGTNRTLTGINS